MFPVVMKILTTDTTDNDETDNSIISNTEILFKKHDTQFEEERFLIIAAWRKHWKKQRRLRTGTVFGLKQRK